MYRFKDKTGNDWSMKDNFQKIPGKYDLLIMDYNAEVSTTISSQFEKKNLILLVLKMKSE